MRTLRVLWFPLLVAVLSLCCAPTGEHDPPDTGSGTGTRPGDPVIPKAVDIPRELQARVEAAIHNVKSRDLRTDHGFWTIFHGILGMGPETELVDPQTRKRINALDHICKGGTLRGLEFIPKSKGTTFLGLDVYTASGMDNNMFLAQGHQDQFIAEMAQWGMRADREFIVAGKTYTFQDFLNYSKLRASIRARPKQELSWAIIIVAQYFGTEEEWVNQEGDKLHFTDVVRYELNEPVGADKAACGGTHRLFGLTWAYHLHLRQGGKKEGVWKEVADHLEKYKRLARKYQNADGSFSTSYFEPGKSQDSKMRLATSGHTLEWLALAVSDEELHAPWMQEAANAVALMILQQANSDLDSGALYHATHGLIIYHARAFGGRYPYLLYPQPPK